MKKSSLFVYLKSSLREYFLYNQGRSFFLIFFFFLLTILNINNKTLYGLFLILTLYLYKTRPSLPYVIIWLFFISFPYQVGKTFSTQILPSELLSPSIYPHGLLTDTVFSNNFLFGVLGTVVFILSFRNTKKMLPLILTRIWLILFLVITVVTAVTSQFPLVSLYFGSGYIFPILMFFLFLLLPKKERVGLAKDLKLTYIAMSIFISCIAVVQFFLHRNIGLSIESIHWERYFGGADEQFIIYRAHGLFSHPNDLATFLIPAILFFIPLLYDKGLSAKQALLILLYLGIVGFAFLTTYSRSAWISVALLSIFSMFYLEKIRHIHVNKSVLTYMKRTLLLSAIPLVVIVIPRIVDSVNTLNPTGSAASRDLLFFLAVKFVVQNPFGAGPGMSVLNMLQNNPNSVLSWFASPAHLAYLQLATEVGVGGVLVFLIAITKVLGAMIKSLPRQRLSQIGITIAMCGLLINGLFQPVYTSFFFLLFLCMILYVNEKAEPTQTIHNLASKTLTI